MMTFSEHTIACHNLFFKYLVLLFCWFHFVCLLSQFTLFSSGFTLTSLSHLYVLVFLSLDSLDFYFFMPFPKNPRSLPPLHFGFLDLISKSILLINPLAAITGSGKTVQSSPTWHWHQQKLQTPSNASE